MARLLRKLVTVVVLSACTAGGLASGALAAGRAFIRVNQVGYPTTAPKRAYLMSSRSESGQAFTLRSAEGADVLTGVVGTSVGPWSGKFRYVYALDFDTVQAPGSYTLSVAGRAPASSPVFAIAPAQRLYEGPLANALSFYENERDGPEYIPSALRTAPAHLNDEDAMTYATPTVNEEGEFKGELESLGADDQRFWWLVGCGRLPEVRADDELRG